MLSLRADSETYIVEGIDESITEAFRMMAGESVRPVGPEAIRGVDREPARGLGSHRDRRIER